MSAGGTFDRNDSKHPEWDLMYRKGLSVRQIADLCGAKLETVGRHLRLQRTRLPDMQVEHVANKPPAKLSPPRSSWLSNVKEISTLLRAEGKYPTASDPDPRRRRLGYWLSVQRRAHRDGKLTQTKLEALLWLPDWNENQRRSHDQKRWQDRLSELQTYKERHGRWSRCRGAGSEAERSLGVWLHAQRQKASRRELADPAMEALEAVVPGWNTWGRK